MKFMILVKSNPDLEARLQAMSDSQMKDSMAAMEVFNDELKKAGVSASPLTILLCVGVPTMEVNWDRTTTYLAAIFRAPSPA